MFYVQVARLEDPDGAGKEDLLIVGGSPTGRGVVTSASYGVRAFGVRSGMPTAQALRLCPEATVVPVSRRACLSLSRDILRLLRNLAPVVEAASIDEFYLDLWGTERLFHHESLEATATRIRSRILEETRISVSIGGGTRKLIAKLAAGLAKPGGVRIVPAGEEAAFMRGFLLEDIPGVGPVLAKELSQKGLVRVEDLLPVDFGWLGRWLGTSRARWLWNRARGRDSSPVTPEEARKSISSERTFGSDLLEDEVMERELLRLTGSVGTTLRRKGLRGRTITVKIRDQDFRTRQASHTLPDAIESDSHLFSVARQLFRELRKKRRLGVRLLGVGVSSLVRAEDLPQFDLFGEGDTGETPRHRRVSRMMDDLRDRFGDDAVLPGRMLEGEPPTGTSRSRPTQKRRNPPPARKDEGEEDGDNG